MTETNTKFSTDQIAMIEAACCDVKGFALRRFVEAVVELDGEDYNSFMVKALQGAPSRVLDLFKSLVASSKEEPATGLPTQAEVLTAAAKPLKLA